MNFVPQSPPSSSATGNRRITVAVLALFGLMFAASVPLLIREPYVGEHSDHPIEAEVANTDPSDPPNDRSTENKTLVASHNRMRRELQAVAKTTLENTSYLGTKRVNVLRAELSASTEAYQTFGKHVQLGTELLRLGEEAEAIENLRTAQKLFRQLASKLPRDEAFEQATRLHFATAVAYMRWAETQNCCKQNSSDSCILPIQGTGIHVNKDGSRAAIHHLETLLKSSKRGDRNHYRAKWLLNIAYMTIGRYPNSVPEPFLIPPESFESSEPFPRFENVAAELGLDRFSLSGAAIAEDFNGDDWVDLFVTSYHPNESPRLHLNQGNGKFLDRTSLAGLDGITGGLNAIQADYDNDGDTDIYVFRGAWFAEHGRHPNSLLQNQGDGAFLDVTFAVGLGDAHFPSQTGAWLDFDNDGWLDLFVGNEQEGDTIAPSQLFRNNGDGTFTDVAEAARVTNNRFSKGVSCGDFNEDGFVDIFVSNNGQPNRLYKNNGDGTFTDVAIESGVAQPEYSFPAWFWDFNNDGHLDLYVSSYSASIEHLSFVYSGQPHSGDTQKLFTGNGEGIFRDVTSDMKLDQPTLPMGCNFGDLNNDGYLDFYLGTGNPEYSTLMPNVMYLNQAGKTFRDVTMAGRFGHLQKGHAVAFFDFDSDGNIDVFEQLGGAYPGDKFYDALFKNPGFDNRWIEIKLVGTHSNRSAIGARIQVNVIENGKGRSIYRGVNSGGSFGSNPLRQHFGLGPNGEIKSIRITWPCSDKAQTVRSAPSNSVIEITEGAGDTYRTIVESH